MKKKIYPDPVFARNLKKLLAEKRLTQERFANVLGKERKSVNNWINCLTAPTVTELKMICLEYGVSADEMLGIRRTK